MGGADRVATWLHVPSSEIDGMRRRGHVDRGWFAHFYVTLTALGHAPAPKLFELKSWRAVTMPGVRRALQRPYHDLQLSPCYRCCIGPRLAQREFSYHGRAHVPPRKPDVDAGDTSRGHDLSFTA